MDRIGRAVLAVVIVLSGCGGGEISREEYLRRAQAICDKGNDELEKASEEAFAEIPEGERPTDEQFDEYARETVVPMVRDQVRELRDLPPPEGGAEEVDEIYDAIDEALDRLDENPSILRTSSADLFEEADELSRKYGYEVCTGGGGSGTTVTTGDG